MFKNSVSAASFLCKRGTRVQVVTKPMSLMGGLTILCEFLETIGVPEILETIFPTSEDGPGVIHTTADKVKQLICQHCAGLLTDDASDLLRRDPLMMKIWGKMGASQPTMSRFHNNCTLETLKRLEQCNWEILKLFYARRRVPMIIIDLDTTLKPTYGNQEGSGYNDHYKQEGYSAALVFDGVTHALLHAELREGTQYCSKGSGALLREVIQKLKELVPDAILFARMDSGFAAPEVYDALEEYGVNYVIKLKRNERLDELAVPVLVAMTDLNCCQKREFYWKFEYQAKSWPNPRPVACKVTRLPNSSEYDRQFIVMSADVDPWVAFDAYADRGEAENFIREFKEDFSHSLPHHSFVANACRLVLSAIAYNLMNWMRIDVLTGDLTKAVAKTIRQRLIFVPAWLVNSGRRTTIKLAAQSDDEAQHFRQLLKNTALCA